MGQLTITILHSGANPVSAAQLTRSHPKMLTSHEKPAETNLNDGFHLEIGFGHIGISDSVDHKKPFSSRRRPSYVNSSEKRVIIWGTGRRVKNGCLVAGDIKILSVVGLKGAIDKVRTMLALMIRPDHPALPPRTADCSRRPGSVTQNTGVSTTLRTWIARHRGRRALQELADRNDRHLLDDIGVTREEVLREAAKWFWQP